MQLKYFLIALFAIIFSVNAQATTPAKNCTNPLTKQYVEANYLTLVKQALNELYKEEFPETYREAVDIAIKKKIESDVDKGVKEGIAKKVKADKDGVRIAELDEMSYRNLLWREVCRL